MSRLNVVAEQDAQATPEIVWELVSDATRFPQWGPWIGPGTVALATPRPTGQDRRLVYTVLGRLPVRNYLDEVTLTPIADGTHIRWEGSWDDTFPGRIVHRGLRAAFPQIVGDLVSAAEKRAASS